MSQEPVSTSTASPEAFASTKPAFWQATVLDALAGMKRGHLRLELPDGAVHDFGCHTAALQHPLPLGINAEAVLRVRRPASFFRQCVLAGDIGFAESYLDGDWETPDLTALVAWFIHNLDQAPTLSGSARKNGGSLALNFLRGLNRLGHLLRGNTRRNARRNISAHYDLSNEFFSLFLDPSLMYSAARWPADRPDLSLEEAQREKNDALCRSLRLTPADHVLEIGTGWGGWSLHAASTYGCRVTTVTISREQHELASRRIAEAGLQDRVEVRFQDYRDLVGSFDKIVSIEMMEAIGHRHMPAFCDVLDRVLKPAGLVALQFITCPDHRYAELRRGVDFIQKHIFPGSLLVSAGRFNELMSRRGGFVLHQLDDLGHDYARTLRLWHQTFRQRLDAVRALGFDERFIRKWSYYLSYCEAAFALRNISVVQTLHTRANNHALT